MMHKAWSSIEEVPYCFSRSPVKFQGHARQKIVDFDQIWAFPDCNSSLNSPMACNDGQSLTHWGRVTHIRVSKLIIIGSDNGLSPGRHQAIIWTNARLSLIKPLETNFSEILIEIHSFSFKKIHFKMSSGKWRPFCLGLNELIQYKRGALLFFKVVHPISYHTGLKITDFVPNWSFSGLYLQFEFTHGFEMMHKAWHRIEEVYYCLSRSSVKFQRHTRQKLLI